MPIASMSNRRRGLAGPPLFLDDGEGRRVLGGSKSSRIAWSLNLQVLERGRPLLVMEARGEKISLFIKSCIAMLQR